MGLKYLTSPTGSQPNNYYRICVTDPLTVVKLNGVQISSTYLQRNFFYELKNAQPLSTPGNGIGLPNNGATTFNLIEADKPINVAQYCTTQGTDGNPSSPGDPEMIYLSPVEQTINKITLNSTPHYNITTHGINVIIKKGGVNSFTLDGVNKSSSFITHPQDANYAYASFSVAQGSHALYSDTGFNAIAYGFGNAESYGYNAGTNIKDLYAPVFQNPYARINFAATCVGTPFQFSIPLSYQPSSLTWNLSSSINLSPNTNIGPVTPVADSTPVIGGKKLYYYSPANGASGGKVFTYTKAGADTIKVYATNPSPDGCSSSNAEYTIPVTINAVPTANFSVSNSRCITDAIQFADASSNLGTSTVLYGLWNWNDGTTDSLRTPSHKFPSPKIYNIRYRPITDFGCNGDTTIPVEISAAPIARFVYNDSCVGKQLTLTDSSAISAGTIVKWYWDYGDGTKDTLTSNTPRTKTYTSVGRYTVTLTVESNTGCKSNPFIQNITIRSLPNTYFGLPAAVCMPSGTASFSDSSTVAGGTITKWKWNFGDGGTDSVKNPTHYYAAVGTYAIKLTATSNYGCIKDSTIQLNNIYAQPKAGFSIADKICLRDTTTVTSSGAIFAGNNMTIIKRFWLMGDGTTDSVEMPKHVYAASGVDTVKFWVMTNKGCLSDTAVKTTVINPLPLAGFYSQANNNYCEKRAITFIDTAKNQSINTASLTRWFWDMGNGTTINSTNGGYGTSFNQYYTSFATYNVKMMVENSLGCKSDTVTKPVLIHAQPLVGFVLPEVCLADKSADFTDTTKYPDGSTATSYLWTYNAGTPAITPGPNITTSTSQNGSTKYNKADIYKVAFKIVTNYGCDSTLVQSFTVNGSIPHASFVVLNNSKLCSNDSVRIYDSSWVDFGTVTRNEIFWDLINTPAADSVDESPFFTKKYAHLYPNFQSPASKTYQVKMIAHSGNSSVCANTISKIVTINQSPKVQFITMPGICNDTTTRPITQASETGGVPGTFAFYGTGVNSTGVYTPQSVAPGTYPIKYVYTTTFSCADSATKNLVVWPSSQAKWSIITSPLCEKNVIQFADSSKANYSRIANRYWDFGDGTNTVYANTVAFSKIYASGNTYAVSLRVITDSGCRSTYNIQNKRLIFTGSKFWIAFYLFT